MEVTARAAAPEDLEALAKLYRALEEEMVAIHPMWPLADGLPEPIEEALAKAIADPDAIVTLGLIDDIPLGFLLARVEELLPQAQGRQIGAIRLVFVDREGREVGVGEEMLALTLAELRDRGLDRFDAHVLPGHRLVKNFFEAGGFAARSIIMHHAD
ncbi:MAG TPA: GNAT family N-acetyltransferase [Acidimicrobiia bacterium]|jgi:ribosomal protein S18 acetylase RimI-like enzyme